MFAIPHVGRSAWTAPWLAVLLPCLLVRPAPAQEKDDPVIVKFREQLADKRTDREKLRLEVLSFLRRNAGTPAGVQAARVLGRLPSPPDHLDAKLIPDIERFDWQPKELVAVLGEHRGRQGNIVNAVACSRDGKRIASIGNDGSLRIWSTVNLRQEVRLGVGGAGQCLAFSRDNKYLAAGGGNGGALWFWKPDTPQSFHTLALPNNARDLDLHADGKRLAVPFFDGAVRIYDLTAKAAG